MAKAESLRIAVIGAGPIGIEAALYAKAAGFDVIVFERGEVAEHLSHWGHVRLFTPFAMNCTPLGLDTIRREHPQHGLPEAADLITGNEFRDGYLLPLTLSSALCDHIRMKTEVLHIGRANLTKLDPVSDLKRASAPFLILSLNDKQHEKIDEVDVVLDCSGTYGTPRWIGAGGIPALGERAAGSQIAHGLVDILGTRKSFYAGKSVIVIGGGYSAATSVCALATLAEQNSATWIIWLNRGPRRTPLPRQSADPLRERDRLATRANTLATRGEGHVEYHSMTTIAAMECHGGDRGFRVSGRCGSEEMTWEVERIIANVGYRADFSFARELHVVEPDGRLGIQQPEPNYFVLGAKSTPEGTDFLLRNGFINIRELFAKITGKPKFDLYQGKVPGQLKLAV